MLTDEKRSPRGKLSRHDLLSIAITAGLLAIPVLIDLQMKITAGDAIQWHVMLGALIGVVIKTLQNVLTDYQKMLSE